MIAVVMSGDAARLLLVNPWLPTWGVVANLLIAPIVTRTLTLLGLTAAATCLWWPAAPKMCSALLAAPLARYMEATALRVAGWPLAWLAWPSGIAGMVAAAAVWLRSYWWDGLARGRSDVTQGGPVRPGARAGWALAGGLRAWAGWTLVSRVGLSAPGGP